MLTRHGPFTGLGFFEAPFNETRCAGTPAVTTQFTATGTVEDDGATKGDEETPETCTACGDGTEDGLVR